MVIDKIPATSAPSTAWGKPSGLDTGDFAGLLGGCSLSAPSSLQSIFEAAAKKYNIPLNLLEAVAKVESDFHANSTSRCGAMGIMQLMPGTAKELGVTNAYDPEQNIMGGAKYLRQMLNEFGGDVNKALAAYNAGPGSVCKYGGVPPYAQGYVNKVLKNCGEDFSGGLGSSSSVSASAGDASSLSAQSLTDLFSSKYFITMCELRMMDRLFGSEGK